MSRRSRRRRSPRRARGLWRFLRWRFHEGRAFLRAVWAAHPAIGVPVVAALIIVSWLAVNWLYHAINKPTELLFPLDSTLDKGLADTWREYGPLFREHATATITPELLAALAQVEGSGNPIARTYWRWRLTWNPLQVYQPASSAVGMYQITDATFREARRFCIHDHRVIEDGAWHEVHSCWFNALYTRVVPSHAVELTAALLDRGVAQTLGRHRITGATLAQKQDLAAIIHLCGAGPGDAYARRGFRLTPGQRCGDHDVARYLARVNALKRYFSRLAATD